MITQKILQQLFCTYIQTSFKPPFWIEILKEYFKEKISFFFLLPSKSAVTQQEYTTNLTYNDPFSQRGAKPLNNVQNTTPTVSVKVCPITLSFLKSILEEGQFCDTPVYSNAFNMCTSCTQFRLSAKSRATPTARYVHTLF